MFFTHLKHFYPILKKNGITDYFWFTDFGGSPVNTCRSYAPVNVCQCHLDTQKLSIDSVAQMRKLPRPDMRSSSDFFTGKINKLFDDKKLHG